MRDAMDLFDTPEVLLDVFQCLDRTSIDGLCLVNSSACGIVEQNMRCISLRWMNNVWVMRTSHGYKLILQAAEKEVHQTRQDLDELEPLFLAAIRNASIGRLCFSGLASAPFGLSTTFCQELKATAGSIAVRRLIFQYADLQVTGCEFRQLIGNFSSLSSLIVIHSNMEEDYQTDDLLRACQTKGIAQVAFLDVSSAYSTTTLSDVSDDGIVDFLCENRAPLVGMPRVLRLQHPAVTAQLVVQIVEAIGNSRVKDVLLEIVPASESDFDLEELQQYRREELTMVSCLRCKRSNAIYEIPTPRRLHVCFTGKLLSLRCGKYLRRHCCDVTDLLA